MANKPRTGIFINCLECKIQVYVKKHRIGIAKFCSLSCKAKNERIKIKNNCLICNKIFEHISSRCNKAKYCSRKCYYQSLKGKGNTFYKCHFCHKEFQDYKRNGRKFCSKKCVGKSNKEIWKGKFSTVRKNMITRGMLKRCQNCGFDKEPKILGIHHIDRNRNNNDISNLAVLCANCHSLEHFKHIVH